MAASLVVYVWQVLQLVEEHVPQDEPPPMEADEPSPVLEKEAKRDTTLEARA